MAAVAQETTRADIVSPTAASETPPPIIPTAHFAQGSIMQNARLSPDGRKIAVRWEKGDNPAIVLIDPATKKSTAKFDVGDKMALDWFRFAGNDRLLFAVSTMDNFLGDQARFTRLYTIDLASGKVEFIGRNERIVRGDNVLFVAPDGSYLLLGIQKTPYVTPSVWRRDLDKVGKFYEVQSPRQGVWHWEVDNAGVVRVGMGWQGNRLRVYYRSDADDDLELVAKVNRDDEDETFWSSAQIVAGTDTCYVLTEDDDGRVGLRMFDYSTGKVTDTVYQHPEYDLTSAAFSKGKPIAAYYADDRDQVVWFDKQREATHRTVRAALTEDEVWIPAMSDDGKRALIWAGGESDPGVLYYYDAEAGRVDELAQMRSNLDFRQLAKPRPVTISARDGTPIRSYLTLPRGREIRGLPLIVMPHGGPYGVRDKLDYDDWVQLLANRGYAVLQPNYRGSGGYGEAFFELGTGQIGRSMQDDLDDAMDWAVTQGIADPGRVCIVGGSYGGYAAMWAVIRNPERYRCAASWSGVTDWDSILKYDSQFLSRKGIQAFRERVEGDPSFDLDTVSPYRLADTLSRPLLLAQGGEDTVVPVSQYDKMRKAARDAPVKPELLLIEDEDHSFTSEETETKWFDALTGFLARHNPAD
ncbi:MAG: alpha/beta fold hydrolase [Pontixanthobacter sp.]